MPYPIPEAGLVISYDYLWHYEWNAGTQEGRKTRPCVIVLATKRTDESIIVTLAPITHQQPKIAEFGIEIPTRVKQHLGLDQEKSWIILNEVNRFMWPGYDLRSIKRHKGQYDYGFIPRRLYDQITQRIVDIAQHGQHIISRD